MGHQWPPGRDQGDHRLLLPVREQFRHLNGSGILDGLFCRYLSSLFELILICQYPAEIFPMKVRSKAVSLATYVLFPLSFWLIMLTTLQRGKLDF